jgi:hypothetical protein
MRKIVVNNQPVTVDELLTGYEILCKPSSNVEYYGTNGLNVFIQFKNGSTYIYLNVSDRDIADMRKAESIGKFIPVLSKKYQYTKVEKQLVVLEQEPAQ